ncbi:MAG: hypothetical protein LC632_03785 [Xanthomonadaceae bacterium]|nr:hypothetical protein [Xanthomonadaceae bacterium]
MITKPLLSALLVAAAFSAGCASTSNDVAATEEETRDICSRAVVGSRIRNCRSPGHTMDKSIMEQQIHRCDAGGVAGACGGG